MLMSKYESPQSEAATDEDEDEVDEDGDDELPQAWLMLQMIPLCR